jgi:hypothetical protein
MSWQRSRETKRRNKRLYDQTKTFYGKGCYYDEERGRYIHYQMSKKGRGNHVGWVKHQCNKKIRRYKGSLGSKGTYRKIAEFWWEVF